MNWLDGLLMVLCIVAVCLAYLAFGILLSWVGR